MPETAQTIALIFPNKTKRLDFKCLEDKLFFIGNENDKTVRMVVADPAAQFNSVESGHFYIKK